MKFSDKLVKWAIIVACGLFSLSAIMGFAGKNEEDKKDDTTSTETTASVCIDEA